MLKLLSVLNLELRLQERQQTRECHAHPSKVRNETLWQIQTSTWTLHWNGRSRVWRGCCWQWMTGRKAVSFCQFFFVSVRLSKLPFNCHFNFIMGLLWDHNFYKYQPICNLTTHACRQCNYLAVVTAAFSYWSTISIVKQLIQEDIHIN